MKTPRRYFCRGAVHPFFDFRDIENTPAASTPIGAFLAFSERVCHHCPEKVFANNGSGRSLSGGR